MLLPLKPTINSASSPAEIEILPLFLSVQVSEVVAIVNLVPNNDTGSPSPVSIIAFTPAVHFVPNRS